MHGCISSHCAGRFPEESVNQVYLALLLVQALRAERQSEPTGSGCQLVWENNLRKICEGETADFAATSANASEC